MKIEELNLYALKYFFDAVDNRSLTKAAEINFVTRSAISQALGRLERWAGKKLTTREKRKFQLTKQGEEFYRHMKVSYQDFENSVASTRGDRGAVKVGCSLSLAEPFLIPALKKIGPLDSLRLLTGTTASLSFRLDQKEINLALFIGQEAISEHQIKLRSGRFILASPSGKLSAQIITTEDRPEVTQLKKFIFKVKDLNPKYTIVESWSLAAKIARELDYCCLIPDFLVKDGLRAIELRGFHATFQAILGFRDKEFLSEPEIQLIETLRNCSRCDFNLK